MGRVEEKDGASRGGEGGRGKKKQVQCGGAGALV